MARSTSACWRASSMSRRRPAKHPSSLREAARLVYPNSSFLHTLRRQGGVLGAHESVRRASMSPQTRCRVDRDRKRRKLA